MTHGSLSLSEWEKVLKVAKPDLPPESAHALWTALLGEEKLYMDTDVFERFVFEHLRATRRTFLHAEAAVTSEVLARLEENQTVRVLADKTVEGDWQIVAGSILRTRVSCGGQDNTVHLEADLIDLYAYSQLIM
ncbi:unnamed protein product, partial [Symbiodinium microadriaticum]